MQEISYHVPDRGNNRAGEFANDYESFLKVVTYGHHPCTRPVRQSPTRLSNNDLVVAAAKHAGLPPVHPHMLRHSCGFALSNRGYDLRLIQDYLGHRDPRHTALYTRITGNCFEGIGS